MQKNRQDRMKKISDYLEGIKKVAVTGHVSPDGDCVGSCLGLLNYLRDNHPEITAHVFLEKVKETFDYLPLINEIRHEDSGEDYDLMILLDISSPDRISFSSQIMKRTPATLCLDHHLTNPGGFTWMYNDPTASSASEVLYRHLDPEKISFNCATCLYTGIVHDTGVFQYSSTSPETMRIAGELMSRGVEFTSIIDDSFFARTYLQNRAMGEILAGSQLLLGGKAVAGYMLRERRWELGVKPVDLDGVVAQLRNTIGADTAIFMYQLDDGVFKVSLRSRKITDVSAIAAKYGGGGHVRASGFKIKGRAEEIISLLADDIKEQLGP